MSLSRYSRSPGIESLISLDVSRYQFRACAYSHPFERAPDDQRVQPFSKGPHFNINGGICAGLISATFNWRAGLCARHFYAGVAYMFRDSIFPCQPGQGRYKIKRRERGKEMMKSGPRLYATQW